MLWPGPCAPLLPVALKEPVSQGAEGMGNSGGQRRLKKSRRHMTERNRVRERQKESERREEEAGQVAELIPL